MGEEQYDKLESALRVLMLHLLKWDHQPDKRSRSWTLSVREQRRRAQRQLRKNPGLKSQLEEALAAAYEDARLEAASETGLPMQRLPRGAARSTFPRSWSGRSSGRATRRNERRFQDAAAPFDNPDRATSDGGCDAGLSAHERLGGRRAGNGTKGKEQ